VVEQGDLRDDVGRVGGVLLGLWQDPRPRRLFVACQDVCVERQAANDRLRRRQVGLGVRREVGEPGARRASHKVAAQLTQPVVRGRSVPYRITRRSASATVHIHSLRVIVNDA